MTAENTDQNRLVVDTLNKLFAENAAINEKKKQLKANSGSTSKNLEVALAVLLVDLASCDQNFEPQEYSVIQKGLQSLFGTSKSEVSSLINQAVKVLENMRGSSTYIKQLKESLTQEEKTLVMQIIDEVIEVDGVEDGFEVYLRSKFADQLGLSN